MYRFISSKLRHNHHFPIQIAIYMAVITTNAASIIIPQIMDLIYPIFRHTQLSYHLLNIMIHNVYIYIHIQILYV